MSNAEIIVKSKYGIHARPAADLAKLASHFSSDINVSLRNKKVNGKSVLGLLTLGAGRGEKLLVNAIGDDSALAIESIRNFINSIEE